MNESEKKIIQSCVTRLTPELMAPVCAALDKAVVVTYEAILMKGMKPKLARYCVAGLAMNVSCQLVMARVESTREFNKMPMTGEDKVAMAQELVALVERFGRPEEKTELVVMGEGKADA